MHIGCDNYPRVMTMEQYTENTAFFLTIIVWGYLVNISLRRESQSPLANPVMTFMMCDGLSWLKVISRNSWYNLICFVLMDRYTLILHALHTD